MHNYLVSVIIPNYCHASYLDQRIQSVLNQTYQNFEVIILDDCSPDNGASKAVIEKYRYDSHISHIVYNDVNCGSTFKQWDKGLNLAKGELIWIAESDDYCEKDFLSRLIPSFANNQNCSLAFSKTVAFDDQGHEWVCEPKTLPTSMLTGVKFIHDYMSVGNTIVNASSVVFKKGALNDIPTDYTAFEGAGDRLFWIYLLETGDVSYIDEGLNHFRQHPVNTTKNKNKTGVNQREDKKILDYILQKGYIDQYEYQTCRKEYVRTMIFEMIEDRNLKKELFEVWEFGKYSQIKLRIEAWKRKIGL